MNLVVGVDAGASSTRSVLATSDGRVIGRGSAGGANLNSSGASLAETLRAALGAALSETDPSGVRAGVLGAAGSAGAGRAVFRTAAVQAWRSLGLPGEPVTVTDLEVAFAAGTAGRAGTLLLSGTGALAARFSAGVLVRRCDGYGWLLGDEGSAVWIGIRGLRAVLAALDGRGAPTTLVDAARDIFGIAEVRDREALAQAVLADAFRRPPAELGLLAPAVSAVADVGDAVAQAICAEAATRLLHTFDAVGRTPGDQPPGDQPPGDQPPGDQPSSRQSPSSRPPGDQSQGGAVVLAGSVLLSPGPVGRAVRRGLRARTHIEPSEARDGAGGAATMAIARLIGGPVSAEVHARLTS
ncbi:BadF/BadG/BcrA/BcrD ATPase family protein [Actinoplanes sp. NBRC 103695]|uniref:N-acetylglucosamine kinase n=1 Tax=Actinoplanes sp. NBRC 103695 TaxID=3032202 RepID=UPI0024A16FAA|nr:BadF/BadG/BcrA/BcrD ATPase family protein [Actinoplanes sp. NBRC 103695]GLY98413.1 N-acetylglucosamine kinase [Actinoplanes sp. NBRC 103695]